MQHLHNCSKLDIVGASDVAVVRIGWSVSVLLFTIAIAILFISIVNNPARV